MPGTKASAMPASSSRIAGAVLMRRASSAVPASTASRIRKIWNLDSIMRDCTDILNSPRQGLHISAATAQTLPVCRKIEAAVAKRGENQLPSEGPGHSIAQKKVI